MVSKILRVDPLHSVAAHLVAAQTRQQHNHNPPLHSHRELLPGLPGTLPVCSQPEQLYSLVTIDPLNALKDQKGYETTILQVCEVKSN